MTGSEGFLQLFYFCRSILYAIYWITVRCDAWLCCSHMRDKAHTV